jgi:hypothetical protein
MEVKGTGIKTTREYVKANHPNHYDAWLNSLPEKTFALYHSPLINMAGWYPFKDAYTIPIDKIISMFFAGNAKTGGETIGKYSAEIALKGIYKLYLMVATPQNLMQKASVMFSTYYNPSEIKLADIGSKTVTMQILKFGELTPSVEYRIAGWCVRALELCGCKSVNYKITKSLTKMESHTDLVFTWA